MAATRGSPPDRGWRPQALIDRCV
ncbi:hypothetical protein RHECNPAF_2530095 [Rhizobium etli CNPAF512]|nr:hypothetical protein RHECNPAF_2530095 [Rhizobium etli CNPAF512]